MKRTIGRAKVPRVERKDQQRLQYQTPAIVVLSTELRQATGSCSRGASKLNCWTSCR